MAWVLGLALVGASCRSVDASYYNLEQTRNPDGTTRRVGAPMSVLRYELLRSINGLGGLGLESRIEPDQAQIEDPLRQGLDAQIQLASFDTDDSRIAGLQVEVAAWLARDDRYVLSRERAVLELERAGVRLGTARGPVALPPEATPATAQDVAAFGARLLRALRRESQAAELDLEGVAPEDDAEDLSVSYVCSEHALRDLDLDGARRSLALVNRVLQLGNLRAAEREALEALSADLQRRCVEQGLAAALRDPHPVVRAAAIRAAARSSGYRRPDVFVSAWSDPDPLVRLAILEMLREGGWPGPVPEGLEGLSEPDRATWIDLLVRRTSSFDERISIAACRTLSGLIDTAPPSLRDEDWQAWYRARSEARAGPADESAADTGEGDSPEGGDSDAEASGEGDGSAEEAPE